MDFIVTMILDLDQPIMSDQVGARPSSALSWRARSRSRPVMSDNVRSTQTEWTCHEGLGPASPCVMSDHVRPRTWISLSMKDLGRPRPLDWQSWRKNWEPGHETSLDYHHGLFDKLRSRNTEILGDTISSSTEPGPRWNVLWSQSRKESPVLSKKWDPGHLQHHIIRNETMNLNHLVTSVPVKRSHLCWPRWNFWPVMAVKVLSPESPAI